MFLLFFGIFYYGSGRNTSERFFFFFFHSFSAFPNLFWLQKKLWWCFLIFWIFCFFFLIFYYRSARNTLERFFLFSLFLGLSQPMLAWKEAMMVFSNFFEFFGFFLEFSITGHVGTHRNDFFYFHSFSAFPILFWLQKKLWWCFLIFWIFFAIFF